MFLVAKQVAAGLVSHVWSLRRLNERMFPPRTDLTCCDPSGLPGVGPQAGARRRGRQEHLTGPRPLGPGVWPGRGV